MRNLRIYPDPVLRKKAKPVKTVDKEILDLLNDMERIMKEKDGIGLAAPQVGVSKQVLVLDVGKGVLKLINPVITHKRGKSFMVEGCLSFPELGIKICRADKIKLKALNEKGEEIVLDADELLSTCLQHEIDHLNGKVIIDYIPWPKRWIAHRKLKKRKKQDD